MVKQFEVYLVPLDPVRGSEIAKTRPCAIISPDAMNAALKTVIIAPLSGRKKGWPSRVFSIFQDKSGEIALDQIRTVDKSRLLSKLGALDGETAKRVCETLVEMFVYE
jgi:mRNA interferase MazF